MKYSLLAAFKEDVSKSDAKTMQFTAENKHLYHTAD